MRFERNALGSNWSEIDEEKFLDSRIPTYASSLSNSRKIGTSKISTSTKILLYHAKLDMQINDRNSWRNFDEIIRTRIVREEQFRSRFP